MNLPRGEIRGRTLVVGIALPATQAEQAKSYIEDAINNIRECLARQAAQIRQHNDNLADRVAPLVQARRAHLSKAADLCRMLDK